MYIHSITNEERELLDKAKAKVQIEGINISDHEICKIALLKFVRNNNDSANKSKK